MRPSPGPSTTLAPDVSTGKRVSDVGLATPERASGPTAFVLAFAFVVLALVAAGAFRMKSLVLGGGGSLLVREPRSRPPAPVVLPPRPRTTGVRSGPNGAAALLDADELPEELRTRCDWSDEVVARSGMAVLDVPFVTVGGGLGSFATVSVLRVAGVEKDDIAVVTMMERPCDTFRFRAEASQMDDDDLLRSDSSSRIDNLWGFPGYAFDEAMARRSAGPLLRVLAEPVLCEYYNPRCAQMYEGVEREAARIGWTDMLVKGRVPVVRRRMGGGYFVVVSPPGIRGSTKPAAIRCTYVHLGIGYPSLRLLPDLQRYREQHGPHQMVHAYEPHDHVYAALVHEPGTVVLRGGGIAASRVLERLIDDCDRHQAGTKIVHIVRPNESGYGPRRRKDGGAFRHQAFNFPKGAFGGQLAGKVASLDGHERAEYVKAIGGSTTPRRGHWQKQLERARRQGRYALQVGEIEDVTRLDTGRVRTTVRPLYGETRTTVEADFVIDATGLEGDVTRHSVIADLVKCARASLNAFGRLDVDGHFEVNGARSGTGRMYASGSITLGAPVAPVDSFFGLNQAALEIGDDLARQGFCARIGTWHSIQAWWRWARREPM